MIITCAEKVAAPNKSEYFEAVDVGPYNTLFYPNVDSCLSITYLLEGNYLVGGHIGYGANLQPEVNGLRVKQKMDQFVAAAHRPITKVFFIGNTKDDYNYPRLIPPDFDFDNVHVIPSKGGQMNVYFYSSRRWLTLERVSTKAELFSGSIDGQLPAFVA